MASCVRHASEEQAAAGVCECRSLSLLVTGSAGQCPSLSTILNFPLGMQERGRKLRIFLDDDHPFVGHPQLVSWHMPPRKLRVKEELFNLPDGFEPLNPDAYRKRFAHMLPKEVLESLLSEQQEGSIAAVKP